MAKTYTPNYNLEKHDGLEFYNILMHAKNMDIIDTKLKDLKDDKVDKVLGKGLSTNDFTSALKDKLDDIQANANNYTHPTSHSLSMIAETTDRKIMTSSERTKLAGIASNANNYSHPATHTMGIMVETADRKIMTSSERTKLTGIETNANNYVHPSTHSLDMITETSLKKILTSAERTKLAGIETGAEVNRVRSAISYSQAATFIARTNVNDEDVLSVQTFSIPIGDAEEVYVVVGTGVSYGTGIGWGPAFWVFRGINYVLGHSMDNNSGAAPQWHNNNLGYGSVESSYTWEYRFSSTKSPKYYIRAIDCYISGTNLIVKITNLSHEYSDTMYFGGFKK